MHISDQRKSLVQVSALTAYVCWLWERSGTVVECLTRDRGAASLGLTGVAALWSLSKTHLS